MLYSFVRYRNHMTTTNKFEFSQVSSDFWKENTQRKCCWLDTEVFDGPIYSYPIRKDVSHWTVRGIFCSLHCAKRYIMENCFQRTGIFTLFSLMCQQIYDISHDIKPAPPFQLLSKFAIDSTQSLSLNDFRAAGPAQTTIRLVFPPLYYYPFQFESVIRNDQSDDNTPVDRMAGYQIESKVNSISQPTSLNCFYPINDSAQLVEISGVNNDINETE